MLIVGVIVIAVSIHAAAGEDDIADTGLQRQTEPHGEIQAVQFFQQAIRCNLLQLFQIVGKLVLHRQLTDFDDFLCKAHAGDSGVRVHLLQLCGDSLLLLRADGPQAQRTSKPFPAGMGV